MDRTVVFILVGIILISPAFGDWPMFGGDTSRSHSLDQGPPEALKHGIEGYVLYSQWKDAISNLEKAIIEEDSSGTWATHEQSLSGLIAWANHTMGSVPSGFHYKITAYDASGNKGIVTGSVSQAEAKAAQLPPSSQLTQPAKKAIGCSSDAECKEDERCSSGLCSSVRCPCGYIENHRCVSYECCFDADCSSGRCLDNRCTPENTTEEKEEEKTGKEGASIGMADLIIIIIMLIIILYGLYTALK